MPSSKSASPTSRGSLGSPDPVVGADRRRATLYAWYLACRLPTLSAAVVPVVVGTATALARHRIDAAVLVATLLAALLVQTIANFANDLFDFRKGSDTTERHGPQRGLQSGLITERALGLAILGVIATSVVVGLYLVRIGGLPILLLGICSILAAVAYTGGPYPLGYHGLGDLFVFIFFGLLAVAGTDYLQTGEPSGRAVAAAVPVGLLATALLVVNNVRDVDTDRQSGKRTLAVIFGAPAGRAEYVGCLTISYAVPIAMWLSGNLGRWFWLPWLTLPLGVSLVRRLYQQRGPALNRVLKGTGQLSLLFGFLFAAALALP